MLPESKTYHITVEVKAPGLTAARDFVSSIFVRRGLKVPIVRAEPVSTHREDDSFCEGCGTILTHMGGCPMDCPVGGIARKS